MSVPALLIPGKGYESMRGDTLNQGALDTETALREVEDLTKEGKTLSSHVVPSILITQEISPASSVYVQEPEEKNGKRQSSGYFSGLKVEVIPASKEETRLIRQLGRRNILSSVEEPLDN